LAQGLHIYKATDHRLLKPTNQKGGNNVKAAFVFLAPGADPKMHSSMVTTEAVELITVGVATYDAAVEMIEELLKENVVAIELCGGFGHLGTAQVVQAVAGRAAVGVVRFDSHPGLKNESGDGIF
jgi:arginase family enzyme